MNTPMLIASLVGTLVAPQNTVYLRFEQVLLGTIEAGIVGNNSLEAGMSQPLSVHETGHDNKVLTK